MSNTTLRVLFATTALATATPAFATAAAAQPATETNQPVVDPVQPATEAEAGQPVADPVAPAAEAEEIQPAADTGDIVVTARRQSESLQNVPVSVQVVTGETLQKLAITNVTEVAKLTPGLTLANNGGGEPQITLRGIRWVSGSGTPAIPVYLNEINFDAQNILQTIYDVGQIEVLRGPQGTSRGAPSISGAITITSRRPDLDEIGGYGFVQVGNLAHRVVQGAVNVPIIKDKLAIRVAGTVDNGRGDNVRSLSNPKDPKANAWSGRATVLFEPTERFTVSAMYQRLETDSRLYAQVAGTGSPGATFDPDGAAGPLGPIPNPLAPPGYNIAPRASISPGDRLSVQEMPSLNKVDIDLVAINAGWDVLGQRLSYNFGYQRTKNYRAFNLDQANNLIGYDPPQIVASTKSERYFHEVRLSSIREPGRFFDYDIGYYSDHAEQELTNLRQSLLPGAFGNPFALPLNPVINLAAAARYSLYSDTLIGLPVTNDSFYGNLQLHLPYDIEFSGGIRKIRDRRPLSTATVLTGGFVAAAPAAAVGGNCEAVGLTTSPIYAGVCDVALAPRALTPVGQGKTFRPTIWNASLSRKFGDDLLVYGTVGTSWRQGIPSVSNQGLPADLIVPRPESATSYELGAKATVSRRLRINAAVYQINYKDQLTQFAGIPYFDSVGTVAARTTAQFFYGVDARVRGIEGEIYFKPTPNLSLNANASYSKIKSAGGEVPCEGPVSAINVINFCPNAKGATLNASPPFQASLNGSYERSLGAFDGYFRFVVNYQGRNPSFGVSNDDVASTVADENFNAKAHTIVDLFAGIAGTDGGWDLGAYAKNVFDTKTTLTRNTNVIANTLYSAFGPSGLDQVSVISPREVGVTVRYAFGSR